MSASPSGQTPNLAGPRTSPAPPSADAPEPTRDAEAVARVPLGAGSPLDAALGRHLSELRSTMRGGLQIVLERRSAIATDPDPVLSLGDVLYLLGPPRWLAATVGYSWSDATSK